jgi:hypothetical protein
MIFLTTLGKLIFWTILVSAMIVFAVLPTVLAVNLHNEWWLLLYMAPLVFFSCITFWNKDYEE